MGMMLVRHRQQLEAAAKKEAKKPAAPESAETKKPATEKKPGRKKKV